MVWVLRVCCHVYECFGCRFDLLLALDGCCKGWWFCVLVVTFVLGACGCLGFRFTFGLFDFSFVGV